MAIARFRSQGPYYHQPHVIGKMWIYDTWKKVWVFHSNRYCLGSAYYTNSYQKSRKECYDETHPGPPWRDGGPLFIKEWRNPPFHTGSYQCTKSVWCYTGSFFHIHPWSDNAFITTTADADLGNVWGATGWNRFRPVRSGANVAQFVGELRDFFSLFRFRLRSFKDLGSSYLNVQFGWKPFLNDIGKFFNAMQKVERTIDFIRRNNNKWLLRGGTLKREVTTGNSTTLSCKVYPQLNTYYHQVYPISASPTYSTPVEKERIWFKARMKYYIPNLHLDKAEDILTSPLLRRIYGADITPGLVWELMPWSWLVDWFGNIGDMLNLISSKNYENLVAKYAYVMREWSKTTFYSTDYKFTDDEGNSPIRLRSSFVLSTKQRSEATPFGFHLGWDDLSSYQLSILGALGLSRIR